MKEGLELILAILSLLGFITSGLLYYKSSVEKRYAAERDFGHIKNSLQQHASNLNQLFEENDNLLAELKELKSYTLSFSQRLDSILTRLEMQSGFFGKRD